MKKIIVSALSFMLISTFSFAQTAEEVVKKYIVAIGGNDAVAKIKDIKLTYTGDVQGNPLEMVVIQKMSKFSQTVNVGGMGEVSKTQFDGTKIHISSMQTGTQDITDPEIVKYVSNSSLTIPETGFLTSGAKLTLVGKEKLNDKDVYRVDVEYGANKIMNFYEVDGGLKSRMIVNINGQAITSDFSDYKEVSGVKFPYKTSLDIGAFQIGYVTSKIEVNTNLDDTLFEIK